LNDLNPDSSSLEDTVKRQNEELLQDPLIQKTNKLIKKCIIDSVGDILGQDVSIQFSEQTFNKIINQLRLLFFPEIHENNSSEVFRELSENSLGYNNLLYIATIIAEMEAQKDVSTTTLKILLVEELEAHLHPQLQTRLLQYLHKASIESDIQIIITTHSPTIAAAVGLDSIVVMTPHLAAGERKAIKIADCGLESKTKLFLERWLDITKSLLLFSKGIILVEGISEAILFPEFVKRVLKEKSLEDYGISVININGIYFRQFMQLFAGYILSQEQFEECEKIPIRCVGITDCDPKSTVIGDTDGQNINNCENPQRQLVRDLKDKTSNCRLYINSKTFEYDLCLTGNNLAILNSALSNITETNGDIKKRANIAKNTDWRLATSCEKIVESQLLLKRIGDSKGEFAQELAYLLNSVDDIDFEVPPYIKSAILFATEDFDD
jgi:predicted ATP-dependent endonuclease of OLD family